MKRWIQIVPVIALAIAVVPLHAKDKKKHAVPAVLGTAQYVYVEAMDGDEFDPHLLPEDRQAIADVREALQDWKRYRLTMDRKDAELLFIVRKGRVASARGMVGTGGIGGPRRPVSGGPRTVPGGGPVVGAGGEVGPPDDMLEVKTMLPDGRPGAQVWMREEKDGLDAPQVTLVRELRLAVDRDYPPESNKKASKP